jgi:hypothetical protein
MQKNLTITIDEEVYEGIYATVAPNDVSFFVQELVRPHLARQDLDSAYAEMAKDFQREREALEWAEATCKDANQ